MNQELTKEIAKKLMEIKGEARGITLKVDWETILKEKGKEGIKKLEEKMAELGCPLKYEEIKEMDFYPIGYEAISILAIKEIFGLDEKDLENLGAKAVKFSIFLRIFMKYSFSHRLLIEEAPKMWRRHYTVGDLEVVKFDEKEKIAIIVLKNFSLHREFCATLKGYFSKIVEITLGKPINCKETKCTFLGDQYHEFLLTWE
jgi:hypothetical protein